MLATKAVINCILSIAIGLTLSCQSRSEKLYSEAYEKISQNQFASAAKLLQASAELDKNNAQKTKALFEAARILRFEVHDYESALAIYRSIVLQSKDSKMRILSEEYIAEIYFENLQNYQVALQEFLILEPLLKDQKKKEAVRLKIAQSLWLTGNNEPALDYINLSLKNSAAEAHILLKLRAQIYQSQEKYDDALTAYDEIFKTNQSYFLQENLFTRVSSIHEDKQDYKVGIAYLEKHAAQITDKSYLELRIKKLKEKQINKPFSRGIRK
jgi:tetratricopeptide (TPR) repeat protein